jgi:hypothetical protein
MEKYMAVLNPIDLDIPSISFNDDTPEWYQPFTRVARMPSLIALFGFALLLCSNLFFAQYIVNNSDDASIILEGQAMLHGNLLLHGWFLPPDSFITTEIPLYAIGSLFFNLPILTKLIPAFLYAATILCATIIAGKRLEGRSIRWLAIVACLASLAIPGDPMFYYVLRSPMHFGTILLSLLAFIAFDRVAHEQTPRLSTALFISATTLGILGDPMGILLIPVPVGIVSVLTLIRSRGRDYAAFTLLGSSIASYALGTMLQHDLVASGTFIGSTPTTLTTFSMFQEHLRWLFWGTCTFFHMEMSSTMVVNQNPLLFVVNGTILLLFCGGFLYLFWKTLFPRTSRDGLHSLMCWAIIGVCGAFLLTDFAQNISGFRYLIPAFIYAGILIYPALAAILPRRFLIGSILVLAIGSMVSFGVRLSQMTIQEPPQKPLTAFLLKHHLTNGLGSFWAAGITTVESDRHITIRQVNADSGSIQAYKWHTSKDQFNHQSTGNIQFVVYRRKEDTNFYQAAIHSFGTPDHVYDVGEFVVITWDHPIIGSAYHL